MPATMIGQCYPGNLVTATYATGGSSDYLDDVLWLTWGAQSASDTYGQNGIQLTNGETSYASIDLGGGRYLCVEASIQNITAPIASYVAGGWSGDALDEMYNIGGTGGSNQLVNGIANLNSGENPTFTIFCKASLDGTPIKITGLVVGDAEDIDSGEYIECSADGEWQIIDFFKNIGGPRYTAEKTNASGQQTIRYEEEDTADGDMTAAVAFLSFDDTAYDTEANDYEVSFDVDFIGSGTTAIALGLILPYTDLGDAPISYGAPAHLNLNLDFDPDDNITAGSGPTDLNTTSYLPAKVVTPLNGFLGTEGPDSDSSPHNGVNADGDDIAGQLNEEDALPTQFQSIYYTDFMVGDVISITIPYTTSGTDAFISGWIDFNLDGVFETSERQSAPAPTTQTSVTLTWNVPVGTTTRSTYMRLRYGENQTDILDPESVTIKGEVEDFRIQIIRPAVTNPMIFSKTNKR